MSGIGFDDIGVRVSVKADTKELKAAIKDFDGTTESLERLKTATAAVRGNVDAQSKAIFALRREERVRNYETLEGIRVLRSFGSMAGQLNNIYQTLILRQIQTNQQSIAQKEAFRLLDEKTENLVEHLDILGPSNDDVKKGFDNLISSVSDLNSKQLKELIEKLETLRNNGKLSADEIAFLDTKIALLKETMNGMIKQEDAKRIEDVFGTLITASAAAANIGTFGVNLAKSEQGIAAIAGTVGRFKPEIAALLLLAFGPEAAKMLGFEIKSAGGPTISADGKINDRDLIKEPLQDNEVFPNMESRFGSGPVRERLDEIAKRQGKVIYVDMRGSLVVSPEQVKKEIDRLNQEYAAKYGDNIP